MIFKEKKKTKQEIPSFCDTNNNNRKYDNNTPEAARHYSLHHCPFSCVCVVAFHAVTSDGTGPPRVTALFTPPGATCELTSSSLPSNVSPMLDHATS